VTLFVVRRANRLFGSFCVRLHALLKPPARYPVVASSVWLQRMVSRFRAEIPTHSSVGCSDRAEHGFRVDQQFRTPPPGAVPVPEFVHAVGDDQAVGEVQEGDLRVRIDDDAR
jgi:hypothetical protein